MKEIELRASTLLEAMGETVRFQILRQLRNGLRAVVELARLTNRHPVTVCNRLSVLREMHLVRYRNRGGLYFCELKASQCSQVLELAIRCAEDIARQPDNDH
ncbi:MAG: helix-turn-helix transcriptional regulator [Verrucomicrobia bacterium]|nr:helix-turn-helix transcriptional regulator [Verrucomicrobiota bacterium]